MVSPSQERLLTATYKKIPFGRDKIYKYLQEHNPEAGITRRQVMSWLKENELAQLTRSPKPKREIISSVPTKPLSKLQIDLIDMSKEADKGYTFILSAIDTFSKYVWIRPLKTKTNSNVLTAIRSVVKDASKYGSIRAIQTDNGSEFKGTVSSWLKSNGIKHIFTSVEASSYANGTIERMNRTIRNVILKVRLRNKDVVNWLDNLYHVEYAINNTISTATGMTPIKAIQGDDTDTVKDRLNKTRLRNSNFDDKPVLKIGDKVRVVEYLDKNAKRSSTIRYSTEVYKIEKVFKPSKDSGRPHQYTLDKLQGKYTINQLQYITNVKEKLQREVRYKISKIVRPELNSNGDFGYIVRYTGYKELLWQPRKILLEDVPKEVKKIDNEFDVKKVGRSYQFKGM